MRSVDRNLWVVDADHWMPGGVWFPVRMVVVRLPDGGLWLHSPVPVDDALAEVLEALGPVRVLVAPNLLHHAYLAAACARWPDAEVWGPPGLTARRPHLRVDRVHGRDRPAWADAVEPFAIEGVPAVQETVFVHHATGTLVCTDLVFHIHAAPTWKTRLLLRIVGVWGRLRMSRTWWFLTQDRRALSASLDRVLAQDLRRILPAHGEVVDDRVPARLREALGWYLLAPPLLGPEPVAGRTCCGHEGPD